MSDSLTLNLGLRYDLTRNGWANETAVPPFLEADRPDDTNNIQPRLGFAYQAERAHRAFAAAAAATTATS